MPEPLTPSPRGRLRRGASWIAAKFQSTPPLLTLPAIGLVAWFATPYAIRLIQPGRADSPGMADTSGAGGTTTIPRSDPPAAPATRDGTGAPADPATVAGILNRPVTPAMIPSWLPLPAPAQAAQPAPQPTPQRVTVQRPAPPAPQPQSQPRPKLADRIATPTPQRGERQLLRDALHEHRQGAGMATGARGTQSIGSRGPFGGISRQQQAGGPGLRGPAAGMRPQWHVSGPMVRGPFGSQSPFGGYRGPISIRPAFNIMRSMPRFRGRGF